jgi:hypothetical protein
VIGTVASRRNRLALQRFDHVILYNEKTSWRGQADQPQRTCDVVYDGVGKTTFRGRCRAVSFVATPPAQCRRSALRAQQPRLAVCDRPKLNDCVSTRKELLEAPTRCSPPSSTAAHVPINHANALKDAAKAHMDLEGRATTGAAICGRSRGRHCERSEAIHLSSGGRYGLLVRQESWRVPAGGRPVRVGRSGRPVASVAWSPATAGAKRTQRLCGVCY